MDYINSVFKSYDTDPNDAPLEFELCPITPLDRDPNEISPRELSFILSNWGVLVSWSDTATVDNLRSFVISESNKRFGTEYTLTVKDSTLLRDYFMELLDNDPLYQALKNNPDSFLYKSVV